MTMNSVRAVFPCSQCSARRASTSQLSLGTEPVLLEVFFCEEVCNEIHTTPDEIEVSTSLATQSAGTSPNSTTA